MTQDTIDLFGHWGLGDKAVTHFCEVDKPLKGLKVEKQGRQGSQIEIGWDRPCWSSQSRAICRNIAHRRLYAFKYQLRVVIEPCFIIK